MLIKIEGRKEGRKREIREGRKEERKREGGRQEKYPPKPRNLVSSIKKTEF